jgi:hypothetical protein
MDEPDFPLHRGDLRLIAGPVTPRSGYTRWTYEGPSFRMSAYRRQNGRQVSFVFHTSANPEAEAEHCATALAPYGAELRALRRSQAGREVLMPWPPARRS